MDKSARRRLAATLTGLWLTALCPAAAVAQPAQKAAEKPAAKSEPIYGYGMMTPQERDQFRERMRNARSADERQTIRDEHRAAMQARAKERGVMLPDQARGPAAGPGAGPRRPGAGPGERRGPPEGAGPGAGPRGPGAGPGERKGPPANRG